MLYTIMLLGIGFLSACALMAMLAPLIHERAVRLTVRRLSRARPRSVIDRRASEDQLRAEHAVQILRLKSSVEESKMKAAGQFRDIAKHLAEIQRLKGDLRRTNLVILRFQARELMRRSTVRSSVKLVLYLFERSQRQRPVPRFMRGQAGHAHPRNTFRLA